MQHLLAYSSVMINPPLGLKAIILKNFTLMLISHMSKTWNGGSKTRNYQVIHGMFFPLILLATIDNYDENRTIKFARSRRI